MSAIGLLMLIGGLLLIVVSPTVDADKRVRAFWCGIVCVACATLFELWS